jgi:hypothetical protein
MYNEGFSPPVGEIQPRTIEDVRSDLAQVEREMDEAMTTWNTETAKLPHKERQDAEEKFTGILSGETKVKELTNKDYSSPEIASTLSRLSFAASHLANLNSRYESLEEENAPYLLKELNDSVESLTNNIDYEGLLDSLNTAWSVGQHHTISEIVSHIQTLQDASRLNGQEKANYKDLRKIEFNLNMLKDRLEIDGFLKGPDEQKLDTDDDTESPNHKDLLIETRAISTDIRDYHRLAGTYKFEADPQNNYELKHLDDLADVLENSNQTSLVNTARFQTALARHVATIKARNMKMGRIPTSQEEKLGVSEDGATTSIIFEGLQAPPGFHLVVDNEFLQTSTGALMPARFVSGLDRVVRTGQSPIKPEELEGDNPNKPKMIIETVALYGATFKKDPWDRLEGATIQISKAPWVEDNEDEVFENATRGSFMRTYWHEFGHHIHHHLTLDEMREWEEVMLGDKVAVSDYVKRSRDKSEWHGKIEDFSESFRLLMQDPALLSLMSERRLEFMNRIMGEYQTPEQQRAFADYQSQLIEATRSLWQTFRMDEGELKRLYRGEVDAS